MVVASLFEIPLYLHNQNEKIKHLVREHSEKKNIK